MSEAVEAGGSSSSRNAVGVLLVAAALAAAFAAGTVTGRWSATQPATGAAVTEPADELQLYSDVHPPDLKRAVPGVGAGQ